MKKDVKSVALGISVAIAVVLIGVPSVKFLLSNEVTDRYNAVAGITNYDAVRMGDQENCMIVQSGAGGRRSLAARYSVHPKAKRVGHERSPAYCPQHAAEHKVHETSLEGTGTQRLGAVNASQFVRGERQIGLARPEPVLATVVNYRGTPLFLSVQDPTQRLALWGGLLTRQEIAERDVPTLSAGRHVWTVSYHRVLGVTVDEQPIVAVFAAVEQLILLRHWSSLPVSGGRIQRQRMRVP